MGVFNFIKKLSNKRLDDETAYDEDEEYVVSDKDNTPFQYNFEVKPLGENDNVDNGKKSKSETKINRVVNLTDEQLDVLIQEEILKVIKNHDNFDVMQAAAKKAANEIGINNVEKLKDYIAEKVSKPSYMKGRFEGLGDWPKVVENAVLTIIYSYDENGVDELLKISVMNNETRFKAINLLCKLAGRGIEVDKITDSLIYIMKSLKEEDVLKTLGFMSQIRNNHKIVRLLDLYYKKYLLEDNVEVAYDMLLNNINLKSNYSENQLLFLKTLALYDGYLDISYILPDEKGKLNFKRVEESLRINAIVTYYQLEKNDEDINEKIKYLIDNSLDKELRKYLANIMNS